MHISTPNKPRDVICLCGSTRFKPYFEEVNRILSLDGAVVLSVGHYPQSDDAPITQAQKIALDELHKDKILLSDLVFIINPGGYIGQSTFNEIEFSVAHNKPLCFLFNSDAPVCTQRHEEFLQYVIESSSDNTLSEGVRVQLHI